jgi:autotransporter-associated beta strand protein
MIAPLLNPRHAVRQTVLLFAFGWLLCAPPARAATRTWDGGGADDFWATAANWNAAVASGDSLSFAGAAPLLNTNNLAPGFDLGLITFSADGYTIRGNAIDLTNGITTTHITGTTVFGLAITNKAPTTFTTSRGTLVLSNNLQLNGFASTFDLNVGVCRVLGSVFGSTANSRVTKTGSGRLVFEGMGGYTGPTAVNAGMLEVNATLSSPVTLATNAVLSGEGTVPSVTSVGGEIRPGQSAGTLTGILTVNGPVTLDGGTDVSIQLGGVGISQHDRVQSSGSVTLGNARLIVTLNAGYTPANGDVFAIVVNTGAGPTSGTFAGLPEGATFVVGFTTFQITYVGATGNDVLLTVANPPTTRVWTGLGANGLWSNPTNWSNGVPSLIGDSLRFPAGAIQTINTNDLPGLRVGHVEVTGDLWTFRGQTLRVTNSITRGAGAGSVGFFLGIELLGSTTIQALTNTSLRFSGGLHNLATDETNVLNGGQITLAVAANTNRSLTEIRSGQVFATGAGPKFSADVNLGGSGDEAVLVLQSEGLLNGLHPVRATHNGRLVVQASNHCASLLVPGGRVDLLGVRFGVSGTASFTDGATLEFSQRNGIGLGELSVTGLVSLANCNLVFFQETSGATTNAVIIRHHGTNAVLGTFNGLPEGAIFNEGTNQYRISYVGGDGNDVTLTRVLARAPGVLVWDGGAMTNRWSNPTNWVGDLALVPGDALVFPPGAAQLSSFNDLNAGFFFQSLTFTGTNYFLEGQPVTLGAGITNAGFNNQIRFDLRLTQNARFVSTPLGAAFTTAIIDLNGFNLLLDGAGAITGNGGWDGAGTLARIGTGLLIFNQSNSFTGQFQVQSGSVRLNHPHGLGATNGNTFVFGSGTLTLANGVTVAEPLQLATTLTTGPGGPCTWAGPIQSLDGTVRADAVPLILSGPITGGMLSKSGTGDVTLNNTHSFNGPLRLLSGRAFVDGHLLNADVAMFGGTLSGTGAVQTIITTNNTTPKTIAPGHDGPGQLSAEDGLRLDASATLEMDILGPFPIEHYDTLRVVGTVDLGGANLSPNFGYSPALGEFFLLVNALTQVPIVGEFQGLPQGSFLTLNATNFVLASYTVNTGNDFALIPVAQTNVTIDTFGISGGAFELEGVGLPSTFYRLEATQDFVTWIEVDTFNSNVVGEFRLRDADVALFPHRFYRVVTP